jgi:hypothetical protein
MREIAGVRRKVLAVCLCMVASCAAGPPNAVAEADFRLMAHAEPLGKVGAPVDVRYQFMGPVIKDQPVALQIAVVPRVPGASLELELPASDTVALEPRRMTLAADRVSAKTEFRRTVMITPRIASGGRVMVLVSLAVGNANYASYYSITVGAPAPARVREKIR